MDTPIAERTSITADTPLGTPIAGGLFMGRVFVGPQAFALIAAPKAEGELAEMQWNENEEKVEGALSTFDGLANTDAMAAAGSELAKQIRALRIGGFDDWHLPSRQDLLVIYGNERDAGEAFATEGGAEAFEREWYWSSTQDAGVPDYAWSQSFDYGVQSCSWKASLSRARAVRRVPL